MARSSKTGGKAKASLRRKGIRVKGPTKALDSSKTSRPKSSTTDLQKKLELQAGELEEARRQQAALSRVLHIIGASPGALTPVFQAVIKDAVELCGARFGAVFKMEGDLLHQVAEYDLSTSQRQLLEAV